MTRARAYVSGLGYYLLYINGARVGTTTLGPGWTSYNQTVLYEIHDVTSLFSEGVSTYTVALQLGNGADVIVI